MNEHHANTAPAADPTRGLGRIGIWSIELRYGDPGVARDAVAELEALGYGAVWIPGGVGGDFLGDLSRLLAASQRIAIASGILNVYKHAPADVGIWWHGLPPADQVRLMLGLGVSHKPLIGEEFRKPLGMMNDYLDGLEKAGLPRARLCLAALGPKMLALASARTAGAHPYLVSPDHTAFARKTLGPGALLAPELGVIFETDPGLARAAARKVVGQYGRLPNYVNNWQRSGFTEEDITGASDRLVDALFAWGTLEQITHRVHEHLAAGADHVCLQVITGSDAPAAPRAVWRELAAALLPSAAT